MPFSRLRVELDDTEGHMPFRHSLDADGTEVTVRGPTGEEVSGHLRREADELILETEGELQEGTDLTIRFNDTGEEVKGHSRR
jgi:hypothetical protein